MSIAEKFEVIADEVYAKGKAAEQRAFWDVYQNKGNYISNISYAFAYDVWKDSIYNPAHTIKTKFGNSLASANYLFYSSKITDTKVDIDFTDNTPTNVFRSSQLKIIRKVIVSEKTTYSSWFTGCSALENITFEGVIGNDLNFSACPLLTYETMINNNAGTGIINHLKDLLTEGQGRTCTLTLHADAKAKLTDADIALATERGWTIV